MYPILSGVGDGYERPEYMPRKYLESSKLVGEDGGVGEKGVYPC